jgi:hypothetical protein
MIKCDLCEGSVCKYDMDFITCGGVYLTINDKAFKRICEDCAKQIARELIDRT